MENIQGCFWKDLFAIDFAMENRPWLPATNKIV